MGPCRRSTHPRPRRHPARRGRGARRLHDRARALAARRAPANPGAWIITAARNRAIDRLRREQTFAARPSCSHGSRRCRPRGRREPDPRRPARARLHLLPPRARSRVPRGADAARGRRPDDDRDRARVPRRRAAMAQRLVRAKKKIRDARHPLPRSRRPPAAGAARLRARGALPRLQRGLLRQRRRRADPDELCDEAIRLRTARRADAGEPKRSGCSR